MSTPELPRVTNEGPPAISFNGTEIREKDENEHIPFRTRYEEKPEHQLDIDYY